MVNTGSPPGPQRPMTATERAKVRNQEQRSKPQTKLPDFAQVEAEARERANYKEPPRDAMPTQQGSRSPEEIRADLEKLNEAVREAHNSGEGATVKQNSDPVESENSGVSSEVSDAVNQMDDFELDAYARMLDEDILNNEKRRRAIESRLKPMDLVDLITEGEVKQVVPIAPKKFEVTFRSISSGEDLEVKRMLYTIRREVPRYQVDAYSVMSLTLALHEINGHPLPDHRDENGKFSESRFNSKFDLVKKYPIQMVADLGINYMWFDIRVKRLFTVEALGNG